MSIHDAESFRRCVNAAMAVCGENREQFARRLGVSTVTLWHWMKEPEQMKVGQWNAVMRIVEAAGIKPEMIRWR